MFLYSLTLVLLINSRPVVIQQEHNSSLQCDLNLKELVSKAQASKWTEAVVTATCQKTLRVDR